MSKLALSTMMAIALVGGTYAQEIKNREENQQDRIAQGDQAS